MNPLLIDKIEHEIQKILPVVSAEPSKNIFTLLLEAAERFYQAPAHSIDDLRDRQKTKVKGDFFEHVCYLYLTRVLGWQVWFLSDLPDDLATKIGLKRHDLGIDLIGMLGGKLYAVQAKYRSRVTKNYRGASVLSWKQLSTFYALVSRTGPYTGHWVMTTADYVRHVGKRSDQDHSVCYKKFLGLSRDKWLKMAGIDHGQTLVTSIKIPRPSIKIKQAESSVDEEIDKASFIRAQRLKFFT